MADHLYTYKRIWKTTIKRFLFTLENQPISPNPDVWMVQRRRISQHWKLAKVAFKKENWRTVGIMLSKQTHVIVRPGDQRIPRNQRVHIQPRRTYYPERLVEFGSAYWFKLNTIEQSLQFHDRNIPKILESFVDADRLLFNDITLTPSGQLLFTRRYAVKMISTKQCPYLHYKIPSSTQDRDSPDRCCSML